jgi:type II secretory pathway predicted ATPase ExeA
MYDGCFGLNRRPFAAVPQIDHYIPASAIEGARTILVRCIQRGEGAGLVIGPSGTGKTLLCVLLAEQFRRSFQVVVLQSGRLSTRRALFQAILYELHRPYRGMDEGEARLAVVDYLMMGEGSGRPLVLVVDEAHTLPLRLLEEIRLLSNLARSDQPLIRVVLAGGPALEERFASPKLDSFSQRLSARCYLEPLNRTETENYIQSQINNAGGVGGQVFPAESCQSVFQATGGVPRLINQLCDHALLLAYVAGRKQIEPAHIDEAWGDLQQLPTPWTAETKADSAGSSGGVIEFGSLDDPTDGASDAVPMAAPALRISSEEELPNADEAEPAQQIHRIEQLLAEADDDFQPAGSIGPEIELCFDTATHPFQEAFEQEEVVTDRYAPAALTPPAAAVLPLIVCPTAPSPPLEQAAPTEFLSCEPLVAAGSSPEPEPEPEPELVTTAVAVADEEPLATPPDPPQSATPPSPRPASAPAPRREYRQLFARLRRG